MRHAQDLVTAGQGPQAPTDRVRTPSADPRVDLVEDEDRRLVRLGQDLLDRERDPRQLAAGRDPGQRPRRLARVRRQTVDDLVGAAGVEGDGVPIELDRGFLRAGDPPPERDLEDAGREAELAEDRADGRRKRLTGRPTGLRQLGRDRPDLGEQGRVLAVAPGTLLVEAAQALELRGGTLAVGDDLGLAVAVAAFERVDRAEALLERRQGRRVVFDPVGEVADLGGHVVELGLEAGQPFGDRLEARVQAGQAAGLADGDGCPVAGARSVRGQGLVDGGRAPGDRLAVLGRRQAVPGSRRPRPGGAARPRSRPPRARGGRPAGPAPAGRSPARPGRRGWPASARRHRPSRRRTGPCPPNASSRSRCQRSSSSRCWSCWPWISTSGPTSSASRAAVVARSSRRAVERPPVATSRTAMSGSGESIEERLDPGGVRAVADQPRVRARPADQPERVDQQALAGAGLAGDDVEPRSERQAQAVDQREVAHAELEEPPGAHDGSSATL